ncbi:MAG: hypothetical protein AAFY48_23200, partial [Bacteroidota bacterium]
NLLLTDLVLVCKILNIPLLSVFDHLFTSIMRGKEKVTIRGRTFLIYFYFHAKPPNLPKQKMGVRN